MIKKIKLGKTEFLFVFRHKWDNRNKQTYDSNFRDYRLGIWFKRSKIVGKKGFNKPKEWKNNIVNDYMIGINLIICKMWVTFTRGGMIDN